MHVLHTHLICVHAQRRATWQASVRIAWHEVPQLNLPLGSWLPWRWCAHSQHLIFGMSRMPEAPYHKQIHVER